MKTPNSVSGLVVVLDKDKKQRSLVCRASPEATTPGVISYRAWCGETATQESESVREALTARRAEVRFGELARKFFPKPLGVLVHVHENFQEDDEEYLADSA
jgi:hypothetical protein